MSKGISIENISKSYDGRKVLSNLNFTFEQGTNTCIKGPSGCGKTTLLRIIAGLETPETGNVNREKGNIAFVFQEDRLSENFNAISNIRLVTGKKMHNKIILQHLEEIGLKEFAYKPVREFSGGMKRRLAIARAVCFDADIILMDEPFKGLDEKLKIKVMDYVKHNCKKKTVIYVTHDQSEAEYMEGTVIELKALS